MLIIITIIIIIIYPSGNNSNEEDNDNDEDVLLPRKRQKRVINATEIRSRRLKNYYFQNPYHATPTSVVIMNLVCSRTGVGIPTDVLWQGALGAFDQYDRGNITLEVYDILCSRIKLLLTNHLDMNATSGRYAISDEENNETIVPAAATGNIIEGSCWYQLLNVFLVSH
jgi:hypothetical protein